MMPSIRVYGLSFLLILGCWGRVYASEGFEDLIKLVKTGMNEQTLLGYVEVSPTPYALTEDEILYLADLGLSAGTIKAITTHGRAQEPTTPEATPPTLETSGPDDETPTPSASGIEAAQEAPVQEVVQAVDVAPPLVTVPPDDTADLSLFYDGLAPYGTWMNLDGTWCWQPTASTLHSNWQPYCHRGNWVYTDYGWAWRSSYSWGWAPFHYGRWQRHSRHGWLWYPDHVWGPAWVCWRYSNAVIGWAPLPPEAVYDSTRGLCVKGRIVGLDFDFALIPSCYTFVPAERFCSPEIGTHRFRRDQALQSFHSATIGGNRYPQQGNRIFNEGPPVTHIARATHQELRALTIVDAHLRPGDPIRRSSVSPTTFTVYRPPIAATAREPPSRTVQRRQKVWEEHRDTPHPESVIHTYQNPSTVSDQQRRGRSSLATAPAVTIPARLPLPEPRLQERIRTTPNAATLPRTLETVSHQRQLEEAVARQREEQQRQVDQLIQRQNEARRLAREQALATQQHAADSARQLEGRRREKELSRQQDNLRRQEDGRRAQASAQQQALRAQREAEEAAARSHTEPLHSREAPRQRESQYPSAPAPTPSGTVQGYGNGKQTSRESQRGADSRETTGGQRVIHKGYSP